MKNLIFIILIACTSNFTLALGADRCGIYIEKDKKTSSLKKNDHAHWDSELDDELSDKDFKVVEQINDARYSIRFSTYPGCGISTGSFCTDTFSRVIIKDLVTEQSEEFEGRASNFLVIPASKSAAFEDMLSDIIDC